MAADSTVKKSVSGPPHKDGEAFGLPVLHNHSVSLCLGTYLLPGTSGMCLELQQVV